MIKFLESFIQTPNAKNIFSFLSDNYFVDFFLILLRYDDVYPVPEEVFVQNEFKGPPAHNDSIYSLFLFSWHFIVCCDIFEEFYVVGYIPRFRIFEPNSIRIHAKCIYMGKDHVEELFFIVHLILNDLIFN